MRGKAYSDHPLDGSMTLFGIVLRSRRAIQVRDDHVMISETTEIDNSTLRGVTFKM